MTITHRDKFYMYVADICDCLYYAVCCDYNNALVFLYELIDEIPESHYPVKGCILSNDFDVVYKTKVMRKNDVPDAETLPRQVHSLYKTEVKGKNDSKGRSNRADKT